jgi:leucyl/phenylalanyl-tRNA--protein transferase
MVLFPENFHVSRSFKKALKKTVYSVHFDRDFVTVIEQCAKSRKDGLGTWITDDMKQAYVELHQQGIAHCLEIDVNGELIGGIYGIALDNIFYGESMFSLQSNGSKIALFELCQYLLKNNYRILDCQAHSDHLESLGAQLISIRKFKEYLPKKL